MANDTVLFTAGQSILLTAGFHSKYGSVFNARIDSCSAAASFAGDLAQVHQLEEENNSMPGISTNTSRVVSYPNPFSLYNKIKLNLEEAGVVRIYLQDIKGRKLLPVFKDEMLSAGNHEFMLDGTKLSAGVYFVIVQTAKWTEVLRLVRIND